MNPLPFILLAVSLPLLLGGCGDEESVAEVKEEVKPEEPVAETKPELEGVNVEELEQRFSIKASESIWYLKDSETPYTGKSFTLWKNGQKRWEENYKNGKEDGLYLGWYENGQKMYERNWKDGKVDGLSVWWHENGQKEKEINWKDGKKDGLSTTWNENGEKKWEENYKDGKEEGLVVGWHENGQKYFELNFKDGVEISAKYWNSKGEPVDSEEEAE